MDVFRLRDRLIETYSSYIQSFINVRDGRISKQVQDAFAKGLLWPEPLIQINPSFEPGESIDELIEQGVLHEECGRVFRIKPERDSFGKPLRPYRHQVDAIHAARTGRNYVLTTGTGSGKSLSYIIPIVDYVLRTGSGNGIKAIVVYPMNALANSQMGELEKFLKHGYPDGRGPVTFARYTGQESDEERNKIKANPPDILLTNYVMLDLISTRPDDRPLVEAARGLKFLVLDELHTYRGRQGADVAMLVRRIRDLLDAPDLQCVGTSATLAGPGSYREQQEQVAQMASLLFGSEVHPDNIIGETLRRSTEPRDFSDPAHVAELRERVAHYEDLPADYEAFLRDPLAAWIESTFGVQTDAESGRLVRATPLAIRGERGAARMLAELTDQPEARCREAIQHTLLVGSQCRNPDTDKPIFAFRLHQFISRGDTVYASLEPEAERYITVQGQQYVPGDRSRILLPLVFCRECGQEYYSVQRTVGNDGRATYSPRDYMDQPDSEDAEAGFLYISTMNPWTDVESAIENSRIPDAWLEEHHGVLRVSQNFRKYLPRPVTVRSDGEETDGGDGITAQFVQAPFRFCLNCGVEYAGSLREDFTKLASLGSEGRSTATTILTLFTVRILRDEQYLDESARKILSFTDNRQDASLQAGHFNDFVEIGLLRGALYKAAAEAGEEGIRYDQLTQRVFDALNLDPAQYAIDPDVRFAAKTDTDRALRDVLGYRLYRDLRRGWRVTLPNLEQCGLLEIRYESLDEVVRAEDLWQDKHEALATASPETRYNVAKALLDHMRRELAIWVEYLDSNRQEQIKLASNQRLRAPWAIDENETLETAAAIKPRARRPGDRRNYQYLSGYSAFGRFLRRRGTFREYSGQLKTSDAQTIIRDLLKALKRAGLVHEAAPAEGTDDVPAYQVPASAMRWFASDGTKPYHDPVRTPTASESGGQTNQFFVKFYKEIALQNVGIEAREHTAQVPYELRQDREKKFRTAELPVLFCSPTMELGVDIAQLNVVNMRNVPPTPANYAQRSGRAGRSGQPALVITYCSTGSPHDQWFFKRPELMVAGKVTPPRIDLANEDLVRSHIQAIWLAETRQSLGRSLADILDLSGDPPSLELLESVRFGLENPAAREHARQRAERILATIADQLNQSDWYRPGWLDDVIDPIVQEFDRAANRWRDLYRAARTQAETQHRITLDATRTHQEKQTAERLRREARAQLDLLLSTDSLMQSDFYSYRYFASEGFLPGYSFPRLPLSAFIPGRTIRGQERDEFLQRPRFLAISEFGPRAFVYHEGVRYEINQVILPVTDGDDVLTTSVKQCTACGYLHSVENGAGPDLCERCKAELPPPMLNLFRMQNVSTQRRDRISSDEEERLRLGYEIRTGIRFAERDGKPSYRTGTVVADGETLAKLSYGNTATLWRINLGWRRRKQKNQYGFVLDVERGYWGKRNERATNEADADPMSARTRRVIPYVEDRRNSLILEPAMPLTAVQMASLQSALKNAIQVVYQLEDNELAAEPLPDEGNRKSLLFYESAEGGAGVLHRLVDDPNALAFVARTALEICHFDPDTGADRRRAPLATEDCEAACYDCLMSYANQRDHRLLDRQSIHEVLMRLARSTVEPSPGPLSRDEHLERLSRLAGSDLERRWLDFLARRGHRLPDRAQVLIEAAGTRPDFLYEGDYKVAIYIDGPYHRYPERQKRDAEITEKLEDLGYTVIRFAHDDEESWAELIDRYSYVFGEGK